MDSLLAHPGSSDTVSSSGGSNGASPAASGSSSAAAAADSTAPRPQLLAADLIVAQALQSRKEADAASAQQRQAESAGILQKLRGLLQAETTAKAAANAKNMLAADFIVAQALQNRQEAEAEAASTQQRQAESVETQQKLRGLLEAEAAANAAANAEKLRQEQERVQAAASEGAAGQAAPEGGPTKRRAADHISYLSAPMSATGAGRPGSALGEPPAAGSGNAAGGSKQLQGTADKPSLDSIPAEVTKGQQHIAMLTAPMSAASGGGSRRAAGSSGNMSSTGPGSGGAGAAAAAAGGAELATGGGGKDGGDGGSGGGGSGGGGGSNGGSGDGEDAWWNGPGFRVLLAVLICLTAYEISKNTDAVPAIRRALSKDDATGAARR